jgi:hypothetical protein
MKRTVMRVLGLVLTVGGAIAFGVSVYMLVKHVPGGYACTGDGCPVEAPAGVAHTLKVWEPLVPVGIVGFVAGIFLLVFSGQLAQLDRGEISAVDYGAIVNQPGGKSFGTVYMFVALFELGLGGFFLFLAAANRTVRGGFILTGGLLAVVGVIFLWAWLRIRGRRAEAQVLEASGQPGTATVTKVTQTGMYVNGQPVLGIDLQVNAPGRPAYAAHVREIVPLIGLANVQAGETYPVKVDANDPRKILVEWQGGGAAQTDPFALLQQAGQSGGWNVAGAGTPVVQGPTTLTFQGPGQATPSVMAQPGRPIAGGVTGQATVLGVQSPGVNIGGTQLFVLELQVAPSDGRPAYQVMHPVLVPAAQVPKVVQGATVPVTIDPQNPSNVVPDFS